MIFWFFVRADYINAQGDEVYRVSSKQNDSIEINGLIDKSPVTVNLSVYDTSQNRSEAFLSIFLLIVRLFLMF